MKRVSNYLSNVLSETTKILTRKDLIEEKANVLANISGLDRSLSQVIIEDFFKNWDNRKVDFEEAVNNYQLEPIRSFAHFFKASGGIGMDDVFDICEKMERMAIDGVSDGYSELFLSLKKLLESKI